MPAIETNAAPKISIIIPSYKTADLIAACLDSVFAQTFTDFEAIVVNDGSPDTPELEKVLQPYMQRIVYIKQENKRAAGARNNAIRQARGEWVAFLDSDDTWLPNHLAGQMKLVADDPALDLVYANALLIGDPAHEQEFMERCPSNGLPTFDALIVERCQIPISTVVARRQRLIDVGLFDEKLPRCDDYDLWVRTAFSGAKIGYSRTVQARLFIGRPGSLSQSRAKMAEAYWSILEKFKQTLPLQDTDRAVVDRRAAEIRARYLLEEGKCKLGERQFDKARELIAEANGYLHKSTLSLTVLGLGIAPSATGKFLAFWNRMRHGAWA
ncbi:MAG TPA: glycosyltransferase family A protein [Terriglobales bacterium]|jgi:glycosyltransferase involved in cell wall biosynthesis|nr:glycosyltransferase family A protein [Terriglobales bacterium]